MENSKPTTLLCFLCLASVLLLTSGSPSSFGDLFQAYWGEDHITVADGEPIVKLALDNTLGCGFESKSKYLFGQTSMQIKLVEGDSARTAPAFYMSSDGPNHNEIDMEFLGSVTGEPYLVHVGIMGWKQGAASLSLFRSHHELPRHTMLWNQYHIRFLVDGIPIRVFENKETRGLLYPKDQAMGVYASVWNADDWATKGGLVKTDWGHAPSVSAFRSFDIDACESVTLSEVAVNWCRQEGTFWWDAPAMTSLTPHQRRQLKWARAHHLVYDYYEDSGRFAELPGECLA